MNFHTYRLVLLFTLLLLPFENAFASFQDCSAVTRKDFPWEISNGCGEMYLADIFYAEAIQNEQIAPLDIKDKHNKKKRIQIDHLVYPTIGNPNLYSQNNAEDFLMVVLRAEELGNDIIWKGFKEIHSAQAKEKASSGRLPAFYLMDRKHRSELVKTSGEIEPQEGSYKIKPSLFLRHSQEGYPEQLKNRYTYEAHFDKEAMKSIKPGMYDVRMELPDGSVEYQYNAVAVMEKEEEEYSVINVTDSQVSISTKGEEVLRDKTFKTISHDKLREFVDYISYVVDNPDKAKGGLAEKIRNAPFITFNGDLHNGGSPASLFPKEVMYTYQMEAEAIMNILMDLKKPIFLVAGNHDGYVSMGHVPPLVRSFVTLSPLHESLDDLVEEEERKQGRIGLYARYKQFVEETKDDLLGGKHADIFTGVFVRNTKQDLKASYTYLEESERNLPLYDGFYHWRKTYGPLYSSWSYGKNHYINMNSYDCRQHRRSGWGMYTVNYGGCISMEQNMWITRELGVAHKQALDVVLIAHHDPRGGHKGEDYPYYFKQVDYTGAGLSLTNYVQGSIIMPKYCDASSESMRTNDADLTCLHDGLQEWMLADREFDCQLEHKIKSGENKGKCDQSKFDYANEEKYRAWYSGYALIHKLATNKNLRTVLLGHTHYNSIELLEPNDELVPNFVILSEEDHEKFYENSVEIEASMPTRILSVMKNILTGRDDDENSESVDEEVLVDNGIRREVKENMEHTTLFFSDSGHDFERTLNDHELLVLRLTSVARLSDQKTMTDEEMFGFTLFDVDREGNAEGYDNPQINGVTYLRNSSTSEKVDFEDAGTVRINRNSRFKLQEGDLFQ